MAGTRRTRQDSRREYTRRSLIETAESMFGTLGIDSVSLRQIGSAAGSANANVVGYHFGTKEDLILAIFRHRLPWLDQRRGQLHDKLTLEHASLRLEHLVYAMWYPLFEQVDDNGDHTFAGFLAELIRTGRGEIRRSVNIDYPQTDRLASGIRQDFPEKTRHIVDHRMGIVTAIVTAQLRFIDQQRADGDSDSGKAKILFLDSLRMASAALSAPIDQSTLPG